MASFISSFDGISTFVGYLLPILVERRTLLLLVQIRTYPYIIHFANLSMSNSYAFFFFFFFFFAYNIFFCLFTFHYRDFLMAIQPMASTNISQLLIFESDTGCS